MVEITEKGRPINEKELVFLESVIKVRLPDEYRQFLLSTNGGIPLPETVDIEGVPGSPTDVQVFFGIDRDIESSNLLWNFRLIMERVPHEPLLPIACDSGGNLFCLDISKANNGAVLYCDLEDPALTLYSVSPSFAAFINKLRAWE